MLYEVIIVLMYRLLYVVLSDVLEYLKSSAIHQKFQEMGISVELPEDPGRNNGYLLRTHNILFTCIMFILGVQYYSPKYTTTGYFNGKPTVEELCQHVTIHTKWYKFGEILKLDTTDLDNIDQQYNATRREIIDTLLN